MQANKCDIPPNRIENKNYMIISVDEEKTFDNIQHLFMMRIGIGAMYLNITKSIYEKKLWSSSY
jgi:hypothetical protein